MKIQTFSYSIELKVKIFNNINNRGIILIIIINMMNIRNEPPIKRRLSFLKFFELLLSEVLFAPILFSPFIFLAFNSFRERHAFPSLSLTFFSLLRTSIKCAFFHLSPSLSILFFSLSPSHSYIFYKAIILNTFKNFISHKYNKEHP